MICDFQASFKLRFQVRFAITLNCCKATLSNGLFAGIFTWHLIWDRAEGAPLKVEKIYKKCVFCERDSTKHGICKGAMRTERCAFFGRDAVSILHRKKAHRAVLIAPSQMPSQNLRRTFADAAFHRVSLAEDTFRVVFQNFLTGLTVDRLYRYEPSCCKRNIYPVKEARRLPFLRFLRIKTPVHCQHYFADMALFGIF